MDPTTQVALVSVVSTLASTGGVIVTARWRLKKQGLQTKEFNPWPEIDHYGFRVHLDWAFVADLEHDMGYTHTSESRPFCGRSECWKENQNPKYVIENGFLAIESFPELPDEFDEEGRRIYKPPTMALDSLTPDPGIVEDKEVKGQLRRELEARRARGQGYIPASITAEEAGVRGYASGSRTINELRAMPVSEPENKIDFVLRLPRSYKDDHDELTMLEEMVKKSLASDKGVMVVPDGYHVTYRCGGELAQISSPTGLTLWVNVDDYRLKPTVSRRRDEDVDRLLEDVENYVIDSGGDPNEVLFEQALNAFRGYVEPDLTPENKPFPTSLDGVGRGVDKSGKYIQA